MNLSAGTTYEIQLALDDGTTSGIFTTATWKETAHLPVAHHETVVSSDSPLHITSSGTAAGYRLYAPAGDQNATIDVQRKGSNCVVIAPGVHHVIVRGLTCRGATEDAITIGRECSNIVIERNDISDWGSPGLRDPRWGIDRQSGVMVADGHGVSKITIQNNRIHHPHANANLWTEYNLNDRNCTPQSKSCHPHGPQGVTMTNPDGEIVVRYNEIYSDTYHRFNDCISGSDNFSVNGRGNYSANSDIYCNHVTSWADDGLEIEGANKNVRVWGNYGEGIAKGSQSFIACAWTAVGPLYLFRNVSDPNVMELIKFQQRSPKSGAIANGRIYVFHNTLLGPSLKFGLGVNPERNVFSRNNIFHTLPSGVSINDADPEYGANNSFDYDLYAGDLILKSTPTPAAEPHGIHGVPSYVATASPGSLAKGSLGIDAGVILPNFNDNYAGAKPDMGAQEFAGCPISAGVRPPQ